MTRQRPTPFAYNSRSLRISVTLGSFLVLATSALAETWTIGTGGSWSTAGNWLPATVPNTVGASVTFNGAATFSNAEQTANRTITLDGPKTVGSILFNNDVSFTNSITTGTGGPLTFDQTGTGSATITTTGTSTGSNTISVAMTLADSLLAIVNNTTATSAAGSLNLTGTMTGAGGFTKQGPGTATFGTGAKTYTGPTLLDTDSGRMRISQAAAPTMTSSFTIRSGAQLDPITAGTYTLGTGSVLLNGTGIAPFPGAIRQERGLAIVLTNSLVLQSDTLFHVQATGGTGSTANPSGSLTLQGSISGSGNLAFTAPSSDIDQGFLILSNDNSYSGGTLVAGGILQLSGANADLGSGNVVVSNATSTSSIARVTITTGVLDAISNAATLTLAGGRTADVADESYIELGLGVNEIVGGLILGSTLQAEGTYGSTASAATFKNDEYFSGPGIITVIPEPGAIPSIAGGVAVLGLLRRRRE